MYNFYFGHFFIRQRESNVHKIDKLSYSFLKLEERYIRFVNNITTTILDEQITKIKVVELQKLYNFASEHFLI